MTYTEAAKHNQQFNLPVYFKDPKQLGDGINLRWFRDLEGRIGYLKGCCASDSTVLMMYPTKTLKSHVKLNHKIWPEATWRQFTKL